MVNPKEIIQLTFSNALFKLIGFGLILWLVQSLSNAFTLSEPQVALITLILTMVGCIADLILVPRYGNFTSLLMGFPAMTAIIWLVPFWMSGGSISLGWAAVVAICIGPLEFFLHKMVLDCLWSAH